MAPSLASVTLEREGVFAASCTLSPYIGSSIPLLAALMPCTFSHTLAEGCGPESYSQGHPYLSEVQMTIAASSTVPTSTATFQGTTWVAGVVA